MPRASQHRRAGFTLIELLIVIAIIGLIISLILVAAADGVRRAEERATQALIAKLDTALNDRIDALLNTQPPINQTHRYLAAITYPSGSTYVPVGTAYSNSDDRRAQVIAQKDYLKAELPDVFFLNSQANGGGALAAYYPINFAGVAYPALTGKTVDNYVLPLGNLSEGLPRDPNTSDGLFNPFLNNGTSGPLKSVVPPISGMCGASFSAASGIYKQLLTGLVANPKAGYDGIDNDGNGYIDDLADTGVALAAIEAKMATHTHKSARSEMLYALLIEGLSPLGSVFTADDFTAREVGDTDGDGLLEFIDAWGEPLQFYRWPVYYGSSGNVPVPGASDSQKGSSSYNNFSETRQIDPLDTNQYLVAPAWWSRMANPSLTSPAISAFTAPNGSAPYPCSQGALAFMNYFHTLVDASPGLSGGQSWDRGGGFSRRSYSTRLLILSGGPDHEPGVAQLGKDYDGISGVSSSHAYTFPDSTVSVDGHSLALNYIENQAAQADPLGRSGSFLETPSNPANSAVSNFLATDASTDDISNHNLSAPTTGVR